MNTLFDSAKRNEIIFRINKLTPESKAAWGKMNVGQMLCHCADGIKMSTGELTVADKSNFMFRNVFKPLFIYVLPMPKGAPTADEINPAVDGTKPADFEKDRQTLLDWWEKACALPENHPWAKHPAFGGLSYKQWGLLAHKHLDHHLKQFGV
jgi:hypothetical protein